jgi:hypothetical protein
MAERGVGGAAGGRCGSGVLLYCWVVVVVSLVCLVWVVASSLPGFDVTSGVPTRSCSHGRRLTLWTQDPRRYMYSRPAPLTSNYLPDCSKDFTYSLTPLTQLSKQHLVICQTSLEIHLHSHQGSHVGLKSSNAAIEAFGARSKTMPPSQTLHCFDFISNQIIVSICYHHSSIDSKGDRTPHCTPAVPSTGTAREHSDHPSTHSLRRHQPWEN